MDNTELWKKHLVGAKFGTRTEFAGRPTATAPTRTVQVGGASPIRGYDPLNSPPPAVRGARAAGRPVFPDLHSPPPANVQFNHFPRIDVQRVISYNQLPFDDKNLDDIVKTAVFNDQNAEAYQRDMMQFFGIMKLLWAYLLPGVIKQETWKAWILQDRTMNNPTSLITFSDLAFVIIEAWNNFFVWTKYAITDKAAYGNLSRWDKYIDTRKFNGQMDIASAHYRPLLKQLKKMADSYRDENNVLTGRNGFMADVLQYCIDNSSVDLRDERAGAPVINLVGDGGRRAGRRTNALDDEAAYL